jgi:hypothetical protein
MNLKNKQLLWDAINRYAVATGGTPDQHVHGALSRQEAVIAVEVALATVKAEEIDPTTAALWNLLDDIDTLDDSCKYNDEVFRQCVRKLIAKRNRHLRSDGYVLTRPAEAERDG